MFLNPFWLHFGVILAHPPFFTSTRLATPWKRSARGIALGILDHSRAPSFGDPIGDGVKKLKNIDFHEYHVFGSFLMVLKGFRGARRLLNTMRTHLDTARAALTLPNIETSQYSCFWECQCTRNYPKNLPFRPRDSQKTFIFLRYFKR